MLEWHFVVFVHVLIKHRESTFWYVFMNLRRERMIILIFY